MSKRIRAMVAMATIAATGVGTSVSASELVYHPTNPTFGGNPQNGSFLLSQAQAQGEGVKSGSQGPDLSALTNALSGIGSGAVVIGGSGNNAAGGGAPTSNARAMVP